MSGGNKRDLHTPAQRVYNAYDYGSKIRIKRALQNLLQLGVRAESGDTSSHAVAIDLQTALGKYKDNEYLQVVTKKQKAAIILHLVCGYSEEEASNIVGVSQQAISCRIMSGLGRIQQYLEKGYVDWHEWDDEELELILDHYNTEGPLWCSEQLNRPISQVYSTAKRLRKRGLLGPKEKKR